ncbi:phosphonate C-P lyase system protein PhnH [Almyronema epifaneia]|uniref:Phosphonate C-P lyase system protein PhnH n=1 Tax=Almyronema epifaneia S1 TaxID=2991925 RepID=A0ABW6IK40_9CYAN
MITQLPGFLDPVHAAQQTFRALLNALAQPGQRQTTALLTPPPGLVPSCAAACLTLLDLETTVWLQPGLSEAVRAWLLFHTGCRFTDHSLAADFALIGDVATAPALQDFSWGTPEYPEASTTLLIQLATLTGGSPLTLQGPGISETVTVSAALPARFWQQWSLMTANYPLGLDCWCFADTQVLGLPRTAQIVQTSQEQPL